VGSNFHNPAFGSAIKNLGASTIFGFNQNGPKAFAWDPDLVPPGKLLFLFRGWFLDRTVKKLGVSNIFCGQIAKEAFGERDIMAARNRNGWQRLFHHSNTKEPWVGPPPEPPPEPLPGALPEPGTEPEGEPLPEPEPEPGAGPETVQGAMVAPMQSIGVE
jgi:hypothetical protein